MAGTREIKLDKLSKKARELFWKYGYNGVSMDEIARQAHMSKMTLYRHFPSKEELFIKVLVDFTSEHTDRLMQELDKKSHALEKIESLYSITLEASRDFPPILVKDILEHANVTEKLIMLKMEKSYVIWKLILEDGIKKKEIRDVDVDFVSNLLINLPNALTGPYKEMSPEGRLRFLENFFDFIKFGLLGSKKV